MRLSPFIWLLPLTAIALSGCRPSQTERDEDQARALSEANGQVDIAPRPNETGTTIPFSDKGEYLLLSAKQVKAGHVQTVVRRFSQASGYVYTKREFDCHSDSFSTLGEGDTLQAMEADTRPPSPGTLFYGSSAHQAAIVACRKFGIEMTGVKP